MEKGQEKPTEESLSGPGVLDKYTAAGKVARQVMEELLARLAPGMDIYELTRWGNSRVAELCKDHFPSKKMEKGIAFPVCISPNEFISNFAPLKGESIPLQAGDLVKVELGVHFDGFPVGLAHTVCIGTPTDNEQRLLNGGYASLLGAVKAISANGECSRISKMQEAIGRSFELSFLEGSATTEVKRYLLHGGKGVFSVNRPGIKTENFTMQANEVYIVEALVSLAPESKTKASENRTTVFLRKIEVGADPKTTAGRQFIREVRDKYADMCFSINAWDDELAARVGSTDCLNNGLIEPLPVSFERSKARVAHFRWTIGVCGKRLLVLSGYTDPKLEQGMQVDLKNEELQKLFDVSLETLTAKPVSRGKSDSAVNK